MTCQQKKKTKSKVTDVVSWQSIRISLGDVVKACNGNIEEMKVSKGKLG